YLVTPFEAGIGEVRLGVLTAGVVSAFRDRLRDAGMTVITTRKVLLALGAMMEFACRRDYIAKNPAHRIEVIGPRNEIKFIVDAPSKEDLAAVMAEADPRTRLQIQFAATTGLRAGEMHALRWSKIDLDSLEV